MAGLMLFGLAVFLFFFGLLPYWFKVHKHLHEILGCEWHDLASWRPYRAVTLTDDMSPRLGTDFP